MINPYDTFSPLGSARNGRVSRCPHDQLRLLTCLLVTNVPQALQDAQGPRQVVCADATKDASVGLEQGTQALRPMLMDLTMRLVLLRMMHERVHVALARPIAAG
jgi:hypothetical protein